VKKFWSIGESKVEFEVESLRVQRKVEGESLRCWNIERGDESI
jgi:hypothetical protein